MFDILQINLKTERKEIKNFPTMLFSSLRVSSSSAPYVHIQELPKPLPSRTNVIITIKQDYIKMTELQQSNIRFTIIFLTFKAPLFSRESSKLHLKLP